MSENNETKDVTNSDANMAEETSMEQEVTEAELSEVPQTEVSRRGIKLKKIGVDAVTFFCRQLSTLVDVGIPLLKCLQILHQRTSNRMLRDIIQQLSQDIEQGTSFSEALEKFPKVFNPFFINMAKVAEKGGSLDEALRVVADVLEREDELRKEKNNALYYPAVTLVVGLVVIVVLIVGIIPIFAETFRDYSETFADQPGLQLPLPTKILMWFGSAPGIVTLLLVFLLIVFFVIYGKKFIGKTFYDRAILRIPKIGTLFMNIYVTRFARNFGTLIQGGVPMLQALDVVKQTSENIIVAEAVDRVIQHVERGGRLEQPLREADVFPEVVVDMIATGEEAGKLDLMLSKIAELYDGEVARAVSTLPTLIQPVLIFILGFMTAFIALAMFWPYFRLASFSAF